jgi:hypothetical protein
MEKKKTNERKTFKGLVEMNKPQLKEVVGGTIVPKSCNGLVMPTDLSNYVI